MMLSFFSGNSLHVSVVVNQHGFAHMPVLRWSLQPAYCHSSVSPQASHRKLGRSSQILAWHADEILRVSARGPEVNWELVLDQFFKGCVENFL